MPLEYCTLIRCTLCGQNFGNNEPAAKAHAVACRVVPQTLHPGDFVYIVYKVAEPTSKKIGTIVSIEGEIVKVIRIDRGHRVCDVMRKEFGFSLFTSEIEAREALERYRALLAKERGGQSKLTEKETIE